MKQSTRLSQLLFPSVCLSLSIYRPSSCSLLSYPCYLSPGGLQPERECKVRSMYYGQESQSAIAATRCYLSSLSYRLGSTAPISK